MVLRHFHHAAKACNVMTMKALISSAYLQLILERDCNEKLPLHWAAEEAGFTDGVGELFRFRPNIEAKRGSNTTKW